MAAGRTEQNGGLTCPALGMVRAVAATSAAQPISASYFSDLLHSVRFASSHQKIHRFFREKRQYEWADNQEEPQNTSNLPRGWYLSCRLSQRKRPSTKPVKITWLPFGRWESRYRRACTTLESISLGVVMWASVSRSLKKRLPIGHYVRNTVSPKGNVKQCHLVCLLLLHIKSAE